MVMDTVSVSLAGVRKGSRELGLEGGLPFPPKIITKTLGRGTEGFF